MSIIVGQQVYDLREDEVPPIDYGTLGVRIRKWKKRMDDFFFRGENGGFRSIEEGWGRNLGTMVNQRCGEGRGNRNSLSGVECGWERLWRYRRWKEEGEVRVLGLGLAAKAKEKDG